MCGILQSKHSVLLITERSINPRHSGNLFISLISKLFVHDTQKKRKVRSHDIFGTYSIH